MEHELGVEGGKQINKKTQISIYSIYQVVMEWERAVTIVYSEWGRI